MGQAPPEHPARDGLPKRLDHLVRGSDGAASAEAKGTLQTPYPLRHCDIEWLDTGKGPTCLIRTCTCGKKP